MLNKHSKIQLINTLFLATTMIATFGCLGEEDERELHSVKMHSDSVTGVAFSSDGTILASAGKDDMIRLLDVTDFHQSFDDPNDVVALPTELDVSPLLGFGSGFGGLDFSPDDTSIASGNYLRAVGGAVQIWNLESGERTSTLVGQDSSVRSVAYNPDGSKLASASGGDLEFGDVSLWDLASGQSDVVFGRTMGGVREVTFSADGTLVASASADDGVLLWSVDDGTILNSFQEGTHMSYAVAFSPDGLLLASVGNDGGSGLYTQRGKAHVWDVLSGELLHTLELSQSPLYTVAFSPDGTMLAAAGDDHIIHLVDMQLYQEVDTIKGHAGRINSIAFSSNGQLIASGSDDRYLKIWYVGDLVGETCSDGIDNDGDGWLDAKDPDCADGEREVGFGETECNDGIDNDHDGFDDAADPECMDGFDDSEAYGEDMDAGPDGGDETDAGADSGDDKDAGADSGDDDAGMDGGPDAGDRPDAGGLDSGVLDGGESDSGY